MLHPPLCSSALHFASRSASPLGRQYTSHHAAADRNSVNSQHAPVYNLCLPNTDINSSPPPSPALRLISHTDSKGRPRTGLWLVDSCLHLPSIWLHLTHNPNFPTLSSSFGRRRSSDRTVHRFGCDNCPFTPSGVEATVVVLQFASSSSCAWLANTSASGGVSSIAANKDIWGTRAHINVLGEFLSR